MKSSLAQKNPVSDLRLWEWLSELKVNGPHNWILCIVAICLSFSIGATAQPTSATDNIIVTNNAAVINGLTAIGPVETTKSAFMGGKDNLTKKAELELKQQALAKGGNIVFVTTNDFTNDANNYFKKVHMVGVVYRQASSATNADPMAVAGNHSFASSKATDTVKNIGNGLTLAVTDCIGDPAGQTVTLYFTFTNPTNVNQGVTVYGGPKSNDVIRVGVTNSTVFDDNGNQYPCKDDFWLINTRELPAGLKLKGSITFSNVLPTANTIALAKISAYISDWQSEHNKRGLLVEFKNLKIKWHSQNVSAVVAAPVAMPAGISIKNIGDDVDFYVTDCRGNPANQTVVVSYMFSNPRKVNQKLLVAIEQLVAFDENGGQYNAKNVHFINKTKSSFDNSNAEIELPTGLRAKGSITFSNILPAVDKLSLINIPTMSSNWDGGGDNKSGIIEVKNLTINWETKPTSR